VLFQNHIEIKLVSSILGLTNLHNFENTQESETYYRFMYIWFVSELEDNTGINTRVIS